MLLIRLIELEPAGAARTRGVRGYGDDFGVNLIAEVQKVIVRSHTRMFTPDLGRDAEYLTHVFHADRQGGRGDRYVIEVRMGHTGASTARGWATCVYEVVAPSGARDGDKGRARRI